FLAFYFSLVGSLVGSQGFLYQCLPEDTARWKEPSDGAPLRAPQGATALRLSGPSHALPWRHEPPGGVRTAVRRLAAQPREPGPHPHLSLRAALRRRAQERRVHRLPLRPRPPG